MDEDDAGLRAAEIETALKVLDYLADVAPDPTDAYRAAARNIRFLLEQDEQQIRWEENGRAPYRRA